MKTLTRGAAGRRAAGFLRFPEREGMKIPAGEQLKEGMGRRRFAVGLQTEAVELDPLAGLRGFPKGGVLPKKKQEEPAMGGLRSARGVRGGGGGAREPPGL
jgi:hypothetical protein